MAIDKRQEGSYRSERKGKDTSAFSLVLCTLPDDGGRSVKDFSTCPIISTEPIYKNVFQANFEGAKQALRLWPGSGAVLNVHLTPIDDARVDNSLAIEDTSDMNASAALQFACSTAAKIEQLATTSDWVVVNCQAGINRSSGAMLAWLVKCHHMSTNKAKALIKQKKKDAAVRYRFKNRYQSFRTGGKTEHQFSWPTLVSHSAKKLEVAVNQMAAI